VSVFQISRDLTLPAEAATWTFADLAIKGAGKTYGACVLAEEMVKNNIPILAIDGLGIWWGLRVGVNNKGEPDPKKKGLPLVVFGGQHKDLPLPMKQLDRSRQSLDEDKLRLMVKAILEARISAVLDTSELSKTMQRRVVATFVNELNRLNANFGVRHVFIEEADMWCPQKGLTGEIAVSAGAIDDLVRRGGNWNLGCTLITQRSAVLNKDVLTQANCLIVLRILHQLDKNAVKTWVESVVRPDDPKIKQWYDSLRDLENGEAYIWHPEKPPIFKRIIFRKRQTLHATREYFRHVQANKVEKLDVSKFIEKFRNVFESKPKPLPEVKPKSELAKATETRERKIAEIARPTQNPAPLEVGILPTSTNSIVAAVEIRRPVTGLETRKPTLPASDRDVTGRILYAISQGCFDERQTLPKAMEILSQFGWLHERREVEQALVQLCDLKFFTRKISSGNMYWYTITQDAKQRIILLEVNAA
jgi:hypothetical protein